MYLSIGEEKRKNLSAKVRHWVDQIQLQFNLSSDLLAIFINAKNEIRGNELCELKVLLLIKFFTG